MNNFNSNGQQKNNRTAWIITIAVSFLCLIILFSAPLSYAEDNKADNRQYFTMWQQVFNFILNNYVDTVDPKVLYEGSMKGLFEALGDPYSVFLDEAMLNDLNDTTTGKFGGIGLYINKPLPDPKHPEKRLYVDIVAPIEDTPGWRAGIMPGDQITHINDEPTEPLTRDEILSKLRGTPGTNVTLTILRGVSFVFKETITRAVIEVPTVKKAMLPNGMAYLRIIEFTPNTLPRVLEALEWFKTQKYTSLIIDLRNNPGGLLESVEQVSSLFLEENSIVVSIKSRNSQKDKVFKASGSPIVPKSIKTVVLINKGAASASEILAGALKDNKRAYLVGETTYGKGSVQEPRSLGKTGFKLTMARYYTPSDANIDKTGIAPDLEVKEPELSQAEEAELTKLIETNVFKNFADAKPNATEAQINSFVQSLIKSGSLISERILKKLTRNQLERTTIKPVYDLEYDLQLNAAINVLKNPSFESLLSNSLSVKELQQKALDAKAKK